MIQTGVDMVSVDRIHRAVSRFGLDFARRILTPCEMSVYDGRSDKDPFLASRFAAKEAIYKAAGIPDLTWQRVMVTSENRQPVVWIDGQKRADMSLSISHEKDYAIAMVVRFDIQDDT